ncbi:MAG: hypothetical protein GQ564_05860 [Bacteroidales bacterium]|nr:hypothetical protein [Bacteroidales bacterium]
MNFILKGNLYGLICREQHIPVKNTIVRLYRYNDQQSVVAMATAQPKELFKIYTNEQLKAKSKDLIAETKTDEYGTYTFDLDERKHNYKGEPVELVLYYPDVPDYGQVNKKLPKKFKEFGVLVNIFQPKWKEKDDKFVYSIFNYTINSKNWCYIMSLLDLWFIFGKLTVCKTNVPIPGIEVIAMDDDVISDDKLGSTLTNTNGEFIIVYTSKEFKKTFLSPWINVETPLFPWNNGPDIYFKYAIGGSVFHEEPPSRGRASDRENVGNCFCVNLCLKKGPIDFPDPEVIPGFFKIGQNRAYHILNNIDSTTGRTKGKATTGWNDLAFYHNLSLLGSLNKTINSNPLEYKFQYEEWSAPGGVLITPWTNISKSEIANTIIGYTQELTGDIFNPVKITDYAIHPNPGEMEVLFDLSETWVKVPQMSNFVVNTNSLLINLISSKLMSGTVNMSGLVPGNDTASVQPLQNNRYFKLRMLKREEGNAATESIAGTSKEIALFNLVYSGVPQYGSWLPGTSTERGIACLDIKEMTGIGCGKITDSLTVKYTAANPNLGNVRVSMTGPVHPDGPHTFPAIAHDTAGEEAHGEVIYGNNAKKLKNCAYIVYVHADIKLTNGEVTHHDIWDHMAFCK